MTDSACPRKIEQRIGQLESFRNKGENFACVRVDDWLFKLPLNSRGVLQEDGRTISHCINGSRYDKIEPTTKIVVTLVYDANDRNPVPGMWAPKARPQL